MSQAASARRQLDRSGDPQLSIGEVIERLRPEFPDLTISKIRFLEAEGLVEPERAPSGYRKFAHSDIERLRFVLTAQRDHYLPLRVIKDHLDAVDRGEETPLSGVRRLSAVPSVTADDDGYPSAANFGSGRSQLVLHREELLAAAGIDEGLLQQLESYGLVAARSGHDDYDGDAAAVAKVAGVLASHGLEPRHLRAFRTAAEREVSMVEQLVVPLRRQRGTEAQARADETAAELAASLLRLHALLVKVGLHQRR